MSENVNNQKSFDEMIERVYPKIWNDSINDCFISLRDACKAIDESITKLDTCDSVLRNTGYPISDEPQSYKKWGLSILERCIKSYQK